MNVIDEAFDTVSPASLNAMHLYFSDFVILLIARLALSTPSIFVHCSPSMELSSQRYATLSPIALQLTVVVTVLFTTLLAGCLVIMGGPVNNKNVITS